MTSSTNPPQSTDEKIKYLANELVAAIHCLSHRRLSDAIDILRTALVRLGVLKNKLRMVTDPPEKDDVP